MKTAQPWQMFLALAAIAVLGAQGINCKGDDGGGDGTGGATSGTGGDSSTGGTSANGGSSSGGNGGSTANGGSGGSSTSGGSGGAATNGGAGGSAGSGGAKGGAGGSAGAGGTAGSGGAAGGGGAGGVAVPAWATTCTDPENGVSVDDFCSFYGSICKFGANRHATSEACKTAYTGYNNGRKGCTAYHLCNASKSAPNDHCPHATGLAPCAN